MCAVPNRQFCLVHWRRVFQVIIIIIIIIIVVVVVVEMNVWFENFSYTSTWHRHCTLAMRKLLISNSLHYKKCMFRQVTHLTHYITPRDKTRQDKTRQDKIDTQVEKALGLIFRRSTTMYTSHIWLQIVQGKSWGVYFEIRISFGNLHDELRTFG